MPLEVANLLVLFQVGCKLFRMYHRPRVDNGPTRKLSDVITIRLKEHRQIHTEYHIFMVKHPNSQYKLVCLMVQALHELLQRMAVQHLINSNRMAMLAPLLVPCRLNNQCQELQFLVSQSLNKYIFPMIWSVPLLARADKRSTKFALFRVALSKSTNHRRTQTIV